MRTICLDQSKPDLYSDILLNLNSSPNNITVAMDTQQKRQTFLRYL